MSGAIAVFACVSFFSFFCGAAGREFSFFFLSSTFFAFLALGPLPCQNTFVPAFSAVFVLCGPSTSRKRSTRHKGQFFFSKKRRRCRHRHFIHSEERYPLTHTHEQEEEEGREKKRRERRARDVFESRSDIFFFILSPLF